MKYYKVNRDYTDVMKIAEIVYLLFILIDYFIYKMRKFLFEEKNYLGRQAGVIVTII